MSNKSCMFRISTLGLAIAALASPAAAERSWNAGQYLCVEARTVEQTGPGHLYIIIDGESDECARNCDAMKNCSGYTFIQKRDALGTRACRIILSSVPLRTVEHQKPGEGTVHTCLKRRFS